MVDLINDLNLNKFLDNLDQVSDDPDQLGFFLAVGCDLMAKSHGSTDVNWVFC